MSGIDYEEVSAPVQPVVAEKESLSDALVKAWEKKRKNRHRELEARLMEWAKEYGGGRYERMGGGCSPLAGMIRWNGRAPQGLGYVALDTPADEVQEAVEALGEQEHGRMPATVIRCEYLTPGQPLESKLMRLRKLGNNLSRVRYYQHLRTAQIHVAAWLRIPFSPDVEDCDETLV